MFQRQLTIGWICFSIAFAAGLPAITADAADEVKTKEAKAGKLVLNVPESWKQEEPKSRLRLTQFQIPAADGDGEGAELAVFSFGASDIEANIRRWIEQFQPNGRQAKVTSGESAEGKYVLVDVSGTYKKPVGPPIAGKTEDTPGSRVLGVILAAPEKGVFFFKMAGPDKTVAAQRDALRSSFGGDPAKEKELKLEE